MRLLPSSLMGWTVFALGLFALAMGLVGLVSPQTQASLMGFESLARREQGDYTPALLTISSLAAVNLAVLYIVAAIKAWPGFVRWAIATRVAMGTALAVLVIIGRGPSAFIGASLWEALGMVVLAFSSGWDRRNRRAGTGDPA